MVLLDLWFPFQGFPGVKLGSFPPGIRPVIEQFSQKPQSIASYRFLFQLSFQKQFSLSVFLPGQCLLPFQHVGDAVKLRLFRKVKQIVNSASKVDRDQGQQLDIRHRDVIFPLAYRLAGNMQSLGQCVLGNAFLQPQLFNFCSERSFHDTALRTTELLSETGGRLFL